jgi:hypothetical protein
MEWIRASEFSGRNGVWRAEALALPARLVLTHRMIFASLADGWVLIPALGLTVFAWAVFRAGSPRWAPVRARPGEAGPSTQVR